MMMSREVAIQEILTWVKQELEKQNDATLVGLLAGTRAKKDLQDNTAQPDRPASQQKSE